MFGKTEIQAGNLKRQSKHMKGIAQWAGMGGSGSGGDFLKKNEINPGASS